MRTAPITEFPIMSQEKPWYVLYGNEIGTTLTKKIASLHPQLCIKSSPNLPTFIHEVKEAVYGQWEEVMFNSFRQQSFLNQIGPRARSYVESALENDTLKELLHDGKFGFLQALRHSGEPDCWKAIVASISERERMNALFIHDLIDKTDSNIIQGRLGFSKNELLLYADLTNDLQNPIDQTYLKQMTIAEGASEKKSNPSKKREMCGTGYYYIYPDKPEGQPVAHPFIHEFPEEVGGISQIFSTYANRIQKEVSEGSLPATYSPLIPYLQEMASVIASRSINYKSTSIAWKKISKMCQSIAVGGCPLVINPWGFVGEGGHVDMEFLVGMQQDAYQNWKENAQVMSESLTNYATQLRLKSPAIPIIFLQMLGISGSNIGFTGAAVSGDGYMSFNIEKYIQLTTSLYDKYYEKMIQGKTNKNDFIDMGGLVTLAHELGHFLRMKNKRLGEGVNQDKLEELKADTLGAHYFLTSRHRSENECRAFLEHYIIGYADDIQQKLLAESLDGTPDRSTASYAFSGLTILSMLFKSKAIKWEKGKIAIVNAKVGIEAMSELGNEIALKYGKRTFDSSQVNEYVSNLEKDIYHKDNTNIQLYMDSLR